MIINRYTNINKCDNYFDNIIIKEKFDKIISLYKNPIILNPFSNNNILANFTNDLDYTINSNCHMEALDFLKLFNDNSVDIVLFDPPCDPGNMKFYFEKLNLKIDMTYTRTEYWSKLKKEVSRILKSGGYAINIGYSSGGIGKNNGFNIEEILILNHNSFDRDVFCVVDKKL